MSIVYGKAMATAASSEERRFVELQWCRAWLCEAVNRMTLG